MHTRLAAIVTDLAAAQFGLVSWRELRDRGVSSAAVSDWVAAGLLHRIHPGVFAVGHPTLTREGRWMAAQLWGGPLGYWTADMLHQLTLWDDRKPHVIVPRTHSARSPKIRVHRPRLAPDEVTRIGPFELTTWARALVDTADIAGVRQLKRLLDETVRMEIYDQVQMDDALARAHGRRGLKRLAPLVSHLGERVELYRSMTERDVRDALVRMGLPAPEVNATLPKGDGTYVELDLCWREHRINVEIDGPHHELPFQKAADAIRDDWLQTRRIRVRRYPVRGLNVRAIAVDVSRLLRAAAA